MPALPRRAPVVAVGDPAGVAAVQVPGVVVAEDDLVVLVQQLPDHFILARSPDLDDVVLFGKIFLNVSLYSSMYVCMFYSSINFKSFQAVPYLN